MLRKGSRENAARTERAVLRYKKTVYGIAVTQLSSKSEADDVFQEVFMTYLIKAPEFGSEEHEKAWLIRTTINICKRYNVLPRWISIETFSDNVADIRLDTEEQRRVFDEVRSLPDKYRIAIYLYYFEGMSTSECAKTLKLGESAFRKRLSRGRELLRKRLESEIYETDLQANTNTAFP